MQSPIFAEHMPHKLPKSTSDDSHLAGDSKQSENKDFAGIAAAVTEGTSDDTHLAADSKRQENAAGTSGYTPPIQEERRVANDSNSYTFQQFRDYYGEDTLSTSLWNAAQDTRHMAANLPKSTSDDSHPAGDSKQSENKDFAGMAAEMTKGTSDETHLADGSKRQENAAGCSGYVPPVQEERRVGGDGKRRSRRSRRRWLASQNWTAAKDRLPPPPPLPPPPTPPPPAAAVNTLLTPRTAEQIAGALTFQVRAKRKCVLF